MGLVTALFSTLPGIGLVHSHYSCARISGIFAPRWSWRRSWLFARIAGIYRAAWLTGLLTRLNCVLWAKCMDLHSVGPVTLPVLVYIELSSLAQHGQTICSPKWKRIYHSRFLIIFRYHR